MGSVQDLNTKIGSFPSSGSARGETKKIGNENVVMPRLLLYSGHSEEPQKCPESDLHVSNSRTRNWVFNQKQNGELVEDLKTKVTDTEVSTKALIEPEDLGLDWAENGKEVVTGKICQDRLCA